MAETELGDRVEHKLTKQRGYVSQIAIHVSGCKRIAVRFSDDAMDDDAFFYEQELEVIEGQALDEAEEAVTDTSFDLGNEIKEVYTEVEGIASTITFSLYNVPRVALETRDPSADRYWFDAVRVKKEGEGIADELEDQIDKAINDAEATDAGPSGADVRRKEDAG